jgi:hypothetical protein
MATDHFEDDIELDDEIGDAEDLDLNVLDDVDYDEDTDFDVETIDEEDEDEADDEEEVEADEQADVDENVKVGDVVVVDDEEDEEDEEEDEDVVVDDDEEEEEDEETLEVLLGPDSDATVTPSRSRSDESGDAPPGEGEFTCRSCFLVKRRAQLADATAMICLDCA